MSKVVAILGADFHLSEKAPIARSAEKSWQSATEQTLDQIINLQTRYECPVLIAGDLFDKFNPAPWLINLAMRSMPEYSFGVPGQHDLEYHNLANLERSAFWTLAISRRLIYLPHGKSGHEIGQLKVWGFPFGTEVEPCPAPHSLAINVAVIHAYCCTKNTHYENAPYSSHVGTWAKKLTGYDVAVFGDNHIPFDYTCKNGCHIFNCGSLMRRRNDERDYKPSVGLLHEDKTITRHYLDVSQDKFVDLAAIAFELTDGSDDRMREFVQELEELGDKALDFHAAVEKHLANYNTSAGTKQRVLQYLEKKNE